MTARARSEVVVLLGALIGGVVAACDSFSEAQPDGPPPAPIADSPRDPGTAPGDDGGNDVAVDAAAPAPVVIATSKVPMTFVTYDATRVIWATGTVQGGVGDLYACSSAGCPNAVPPPPLAASTSFGYLATTGVVPYVSFGYTGNTRGIERIEPSGALTAIQTVTTRAALFNMYLHGESMFVMSYTGGDGGSPFPRKIFAVSSATNAVQPVGEYLAATAINTGTLVVTDERVFLGAHNTGVIVSCARSACEFENFGVGTEFYASTMTADAQAIYWANGGALFSCPIGAKCLPGPTTELAPPASPNVLAVDQRDGFLYIEREDGSLIECAPGTCSGTPRLLVKEPAFHFSGMSARNFVVAATDIYYVAKDGSADAGTLSYRLMRLPRALR